MTVPEGSEEMEEPNGADELQRRRSDLVEQVERGLAVALQDYRHQAEEVLATHLLELERTEHGFELEMSKLRAENARLRESLGLQAHPPGSLWQTVMFQKAEDQARESWNANGMKKKQVASAQKRDDDDDMPLNSRKIATSKQNQQQAGQWQHFVAWVPTAAGLLSPQPWRPLPSEAIAARSFQASGTGTEDFLLPGMVGDDERPERRKKEKDRRSEDGDSSDSDSHDGEEKERYEVLQFFRASQRQLDRIRKNGVFSDYGSSAGGSDMGESMSYDEDYDAQKRQWFIIHPSAKKRVAWDIGSLIMVVYDMIMIPMTAFDLPQEGFLSAMDWVTRLFWTFDIGWSLLTAIVLSDGHINFSFRYILKRYLRTWFGPDLLIVSSDWMEVLLSSTSVLGLGRLARAFRMARVVRLLRLVRMQEVMQTITERVQSDKLAFVLSTAKLLTFVLVTAHVLACLWWAVGRAFDGSDTWIETGGYAVRTVPGQYLVALHWALCQFTGGMDEVIAINTLERFYTVCAWTFAFMATAVIGSMLTSNLTHLYIIGGAQARQLSTLRKYLKQNNISSQLVLQVQRSAQHAVMSDLAAEDVQLLSVVAEPLRVEISFEMFSPIMRNHPLFADYHREDPQVMRRICHSAMTMRLLERGDVVFSKGEVPREPKMYFIVKGLFEYYCRHETLTVGERQWAAEPFLWTSWKHKGTLTASTEAKLAVLDAQTFRDIVRRFKSKTSGYDPRLYVNEFVNHLNQSSKVDDLTFLS